MNAQEKQLAESLLPCPHCGKAPNLDVIGLGDERDKQIETWFYRNLRLGKTYYRIECCSMMEGLDWDELSGTWNRREPPCKESLDEAMERLRARLKAKKAADALKPKRPVSKPPRYDDVYFEGLDWLNGEPLPEESVLVSIQSEAAELKELIDATPKDRVIERKSLEARLLEVQKEGWELIKRWPEVRAKAFPELVEMDRKFEEMRRSCMKRFSMERGVNMANEAILTDHLNN